MRLIDADKLLEEVEDSWVEGGWWFEDRIKEASTIEVTEWISVKDKLPEKEQEVRLLCEIRPSGRTYQCHGFYFPEGVYREDSDFSWDYEACDKYDLERDDYLIKAGWYERIHNWDEYSAVAIGDFVTYWMPLPSPPKSE